MTADSRDRRPRRPYPLRHAFAGLGRCRGALLALAAVSSAGLAPIALALAAPPVAAPAAGALASGANPAAAGVPASGALPARSAPAGPALPAPSDLAPPDLPVRSLLLLLADRRIYEPVTVREALKGGPALRTQLAVTLGRARDPQGVRVLSELVHDESAPVRRAAAFALGMAGDASARPALLGAVQDPDHETGLRAVEALGKLGAGVVETAEQLLALPEEERWARLVPSLYRFREIAMVPLAQHGLTLADRELHARAAYALAREPLPQAGPLLRPLLADADPRVRGWAARGLSHAGTVEDLAALRPLLDDREPGPIVQALRAGRAILLSPAASATAAGPAAAPADWRPRLVQLLADPRPHVRLAVLDVAGLWLPGAELGDALARIARGGTGRERGLALVALATGKDPRAAELVSAAAGAPDADVRARAAEAAALVLAAGDPAGPPAAAVSGEPAAATSGQPAAASSSQSNGASSGQRSGTPSGQAAGSVAESPAAASAQQAGASPEKHAGAVSERRTGTPSGQRAGSTSGPPAASSSKSPAPVAPSAVSPSALLARLGADPSPLVREAALGARLPAHVQAGSEAERQALALARRALADSDEGVRTTVLGWLTEHPVVPLAELEPALRRATADRTDESGLGAVQALAARAQAQPLERGAIVAVLEKVATVPRYVLRREAGVALGKLGRPVPPAGQPEPAREQDVYREMLVRTARPRTVAIATNRGTLQVRLTCPETPLTCLDFLTLAEQGFYDGLTFHRVVPDFVVQGGDPHGDGFGGPGYAIRDEVNPLSFDRRGILGMALAGPDTGGSQFFITLSPQPHLDGAFTAFGEVIAGAEVLDAIVPGDRIEKISELR
jgi:cyclophilin family peptidyl-prolyl cis-trans isomerase/HEAT repeat protein